MPELHTIVLASTGTDGRTRLTVDSLRTHHPDIAITLVVTHPLADVAAAEVAAAEDSASSNVEVVSARDFMVGEFRYIDAWVGGGQRFARWAVIPQVVAAIGSGGPLLVLSDSAWILGALNDVVEAVTHDSIGLLPVNWDAPSATYEPGWIDEVAIIGANATSVLTQWERTAEEALSGTTLRSAAFWGSPWAEFLAGGDRIEAIADPSVRVAPTTVSRLYRGELPDGTAPRLAQFPRFDPAAPWRFTTDVAVDVATATSEPTLLISQSDRLSRLVTDYAAALTAADQDIPAPDPILDEDIVGLRTSPEFRDIVRQHLLSEPAPPTGRLNPFDPATSAAFLDWYRAPRPSSQTGISYSADAVWNQRPDLAAAFSPLSPDSRRRFSSWLWSYGLNERVISLVALPPQPLPAPLPDTVSAERSFGVNLIGYHAADLGLGVAVRRMATALDAADIPWRAINNTNTVSRQTEGRGDAAYRADTDDGSDTQFWFNLVLIAPDQLESFVTASPANRFADRYTIGLWYWETSVLPDQHRGGFAFVDEVWASTDFLRDIFATQDHTPVTEVGVPLEFPAPTGAVSRADLGLDDRFTFLFVFDFLSSVRRKNPAELIDAYVQAFPQAGNTRLIIKSINGDVRLNQLESLRFRARDRTDIEIWDSYLDDDAHATLIAEADCYVSLHRSEGLGLTMAEAMANGTPVIATGYSGNLDFMANGGALLIDATEVAVGEGCEYPADGVWAQPDIGQAAEAMASVASDADLRTQLIEAGHREVQRFGANAIGAAAKQRLEDLWSRRGC